MYIAMYMPSDGPGKYPRSVAGFKTEKCAWDYVLTQMCRACKAERQAALDGVKVWDSYVDDAGEKHEFEPSEFPGCLCEWEIQPHEDLTAEQLFEIAGWNA